MDLLMCLLEPDWACHWNRCSIIIRTVPNLSVLFDLRNHQMKKFIPFYLVLLVSLFGCLGSQQTATQSVPDVAPSETETSRALAALQLSTPKTTYTVKEEIPLELGIQNGAFDLLVPFVHVATIGAFTRLTVTDATGNIVAPKRPITRENPQKYVMHEGKSVRCIQGFELKAETQQGVSLGDLQKYYRLPAGNYTVRLTIELEVYREFITELHPQVIEWQRDLARLQNDSSLPAEAKRDRMNHIQEQIDFIQEKHKDEVKDIYLPVKSRRGKAMLSSNSIALTVE